MGDVLELHEVEIAMVDKPPISEADGSVDGRVGTAKGSVLHEMDSLLEGLD